LARHAYSFYQTNEVDVAGLERLTAFYIEAGANGLFANCLSSEMYQLTEQERLLITKTVVNQCAGKTPVVATGTFSRDLSTDAEFIKRIYDTGVQAVILISSMLVDPDENEEAF